MGKRATRLGLSTIGVGGLLVYAALMLWVSGVATIDSADGNPGLLDWSGTVPLVGMLGLALVVFGIDRVARVFVGRESVSA